MLKTYIYLRTVCNLQQETESIAKLVPSEMIIRDKTDKGNTEENLEFCFMLNFNLQKQEILRMYLHGVLLMIVSGKCFTYRFLF